MASARGALLEAALEEFSEHGYEATTVAAIADRAGVTTGALYAHFDSKLDLLVSTIGLVDLAEFWRSLASDAAIPWEVLTAAIQPGGRARLDRRMLLLLDAIVLARRDPDVATTLRRGLHSFLRAVERTVDQAEGAGLVDPRFAPEDLARIGVVLIFGMMVLDTLDEPLLPEDAFEQLVALMMPASPADAGELPSDLARVRSRAAAAEDADARLRAAIEAASDAGHSLRRIGSAAGLSHERVRRILGERAEG